MTMLPPELPPNAHTRATNVISYVLVAAMIVAVLWLHPLPVAIAGFLVYVLARKLEARLRWHHALLQRAKATVVICAFVTAAFTLVALDTGIGRLAKHGHGPEGMLTRIADVLDNLRELLPAAVVSHVPQSVTELRVQLVQVTKEHDHQVSALDIDELQVNALMLAGLILGVTVAWSETFDSEHHKPLVAALVSRLSRLTDIFEAVVFAQVKISALNTTLATIYLLGALPLFGQHVPYFESLILLTFAAGLIPVVGNFISNTAIIVMSATASLELAAASLIFLMVVHKPEYFVNVRIIGSHIDAWAWELILVSIVVEVLLGVGGVTAAPVLCAYMKRELTDTGFIG